MGSVDVDLFNWLTQLDGWLLGPKKLSEKCTAVRAPTTQHCTMDKTGILFQKLFCLKSLYKSCAGRLFYGTENVIWAGFGPVGNTEKNCGWLWAIFEGGFFMFSWAKKCLKTFFKNIVLSPLKSCIKSLLQNFFLIFLAQNRLNVHNQLCIAVLYTPLCATSI